MSVKTSNKIISTAVVLSISILIGASIMISLISKSRNLKIALITSASILFLFTAIGVVYHLIINNAIRKPVSNDVTTQYIDGVINTSIIGNATNTIETNNADSHIATNDFNQQLPVKDNNTPTDSKEAKKTIEATIPKLNNYTSQVNTGQNDKKMKAINKTISEISTIVATLKNITPADDKGNHNNITQSVNKFIEITPKAIKDLKSETLSLMLDNKCNTEDIKSMIEVLKVNLTNIKYCIILNDYKPNSKISEAKSAEEISEQHTQVEMI